MIFLAGLVNSAPPFITSTGDGLEIFINFQEALSVNQEYEVEIHVTNKTNGVPISSGISCSLHLYSASGDHLFSGTDNTPSNNLDYSFLLNASNFSNNGEYPYFAFCNSSTLGGSISSFFAVTPNGEIGTTSKAIFYSGLIFVLIFFLGVAIYNFIEFDNLLNRVGMLGVIYLLLIAITFISWHMASDFIISSPFLISMLRIMFLLLVIGLFPLVLGGFAWYVLMLFKIKEINRLMTKGFSLEDAKRRSSR